MKKKFQWLLKPQNLSVTLWLFFILIFICSLIYGIAIQIDDDNRYHYLRYMIITIFVTFAGIVFVDIWRKAVTEKDEPVDITKIDYGLVWLAGAMIFWSLQTLYGLLGLYYDQWLKDNQLNNTYTNLQPLFSCINSACFIGSIVYFDYRKEILKYWPIKQLSVFFKMDRKKFILWAKIYITIVFILLIVVGASVRNTFELSWPITEQVNWSPFLDAILLGTPTIFILVIILWETWTERSYKWIPWLCLLILLMTLIIQFTNSSDVFAKSYPLLNFSSLILYKILLTMIFFALAFSWIEEKAGKQLAGERKDMTHIIRDSLILLNNDFKRILDNEEDKVKDIFLKYQTKVQFMLEAHKNMHDTQRLSEKTKDYFEQRIKILIGLLCLPENSFTYQNRLTNDMDISSGVKKDLAFFIGELMINAVKYSSPNNIKIHLSLNLLKEKENHWVILQVTDNGPGIDMITAKKKANHGFKTIFSKVYDFYEGEVTFNPANPQNKDYPGTIILIKIPIKL